MQSRAASKPHNILFCAHGSQVIEVRELGSIRHGSKVIGKCFGVCLVRDPEGRVSGLVATEYNTGKIGLSLVAAVGDDEAGENGWSDEHIGGFDLDSFDCD